MRACATWAVPGSGLVKAQAEAEGLDRVFSAAGFEWRAGRVLACALARMARSWRPAERCASTTNRNFVGRQGPGARTHLMSPPMAAAAADHRPAHRRAPSLPEAIAVRKFERIEAVGACRSPSRMSTPTRSSRRAFSAVAAPPGSPNACSAICVFDADGAERPDFLLNQDGPIAARIILVAGENFGCGSSRENAVWALFDYGIRVVIAPCVGDIFYNNCLKNGVLPAVLPRDAIASLLPRSKPRPERGSPSISRARRSPRRTAGCTPSTSTPSPRTAS